MKKNKKIEKKYLNIINKIERMRKKNNSNWMNLLKIAFKYSPYEAANVMKSINEKDKRISYLLNKLSK